MYDQIIGHCPHCGSPIYSPGIWHGVTPPPSIKSCMCVPTAQQYEIVTSTGIAIEDNFKVNYENVLDEEKFKEVFKKEEM